MSSVCESEKSVMMVCFVPWHSVEGTPGDFQWYGPIVSDHLLVRKQLKAKCQLEPKKEFFVAKTGMRATPRCVNVLKNMRVVSCLSSSRSDREVLAQITLSVSRSCAAESNT